jgi:quinolinate synthase
MSSAASQVTIATRSDRAGVATASPRDRQLPLLVLGQAADPHSERGVSCTGELPAPSDPALVDRAQRARAALGDRAFVLGHHYQRDEVIRFADVTGDSFKLARDAASKPTAEFVIFCGVHFMAESADILTSASQQVILPDLAAGCSMADMASYNQVEECWETLEDLGISEAVVPVTYMNSSADIKAFTGRHGGTVCTSSNAKRALTWALGDRVGGGGGGGGEKVLFLPDQHLGRNTAVLELGLRQGDCVVWDPRKAYGGSDPDSLRRATMILWKGHCSVHGRFRASNVADARNRIPGINVIVHPECVHDVVLAADYIGSTEKIISTIEQAPAGSAWAVGTELNLVQRLAQNNPDKTIVFLDKTVCFCSTMNRIDLPHLVWALESLANGHVVNQITVDPQTTAQARAALDQMLALP